VREFDNPQAWRFFVCDDAEQQIWPEKQALDQSRAFRVGAVYANSLTDGLVKNFPLWRDIPDPNNPSKPHPFRYGESR
jgi:hypothetical protein